MMTSSFRDWQLGTASIIGAGTVCVYVLAYSLDVAYRRANETVCNFALLLGFITALGLNRGWREMGFCAYLYTLLVAVALLSRISESLKPFLFLLTLFIVGMSLAYSGRAILRAGTVRHSLPTKDIAIAAVLILMPLIWVSAYYHSEAATRVLLESLHFKFYLGMCIFMMAFCWLRLNRHAYELWVESWARPMYRIRGAGPGLSVVPTDGPLLLIANHACWWDPLFLAGVVDRPITPMMTAGFYDIWHLRPFMKHVIRAIRVPEKVVRHEAPEIQEAVAALHRGECLVIFPEGYLRRKEEVPLRRFGRGVWEILKAAPDTPVLAAWIEGGWGSWCSWKDGPPCKNKRIDMRRPILVGFSAPVRVPTEVLANHWATRMHLMNLVSASRRHAGLEPLPAFTIPTTEETEEAAP